MAATRVPDSLLAREPGRLVGDPLSSDDRQYRSPELFQKSRTLGCSLDVMLANSNGQLGEHVDILAVIAPSAAQHEIGAHDRITLDGRQLACIDGVGEQVRQRPGVDNAQANGDWTEVRRCLASIVKLKQPTGHGPLPVFETALGRDQLRNLQLGPRLGLGKRLDRGVQPIESGFDAFEAGFGTGLGLDELADEGRELNQVIGEHVSAQLSTPFRALS